MAAKPPGIVFGNAFQKIGEALQNAGDKMEHQGEMHEGDVTEARTKGITVGQARHLRLAREATEAGKPEESTFHQEKADMAQARRAHRNGRIGRGDLLRAQAEFSDAKEAYKATKARHSGSRVATEPTAPPPVALTRIPDFVPEPVTSDLTGGALTRAGYQNKLNEALYYAFALGTNSNLPKGETYDDYKLAADGSVGDATKKAIELYEKLYPPGTDTTADVYYTTQTARYGTGFTDSFVLEIEARCGKFCATVATHNADVDAAAKRV